MLVALYLYTELHTNILSHRNCVYIHYQDNILCQVFLNNSACTLCTVHKQYWVADIVIYQSYLLTYIYDYYKRYNFTEWSMSINSFLFLRKNETNNYDIFY